MPSAFITVSSLVSFMVVAYALLFVVRLVLVEYFRLKNMLAGACHELRELNSKLQQAGTLTAAARDFAELFKMEEEETGETRSEEGEDDEREGGGGGDHKMREEREKGGKGEMNTGKDTILP